MDFIFTFTLFINYGHSLHLLHQSYFLHYFQHPRFWLTNVQFTDAGSWVAFTLLSVQQMFMFKFLNL